MQGQSSAPNSPASPSDVRKEGTRGQYAPPGRPKVPESPYATPESSLDADRPQQSSLEARGEQQAQEKHRQSTAEQRERVKGGPPEPPGQPARNPVDSNEVGRSTDAPKNVVRLFGCGGLPTSILWEAWRGVCVYVEHLQERTGHFNRVIREGRWLICRRWCPSAAEGRCAACLCGRRCTAFPPTCPARMHPPCRCPSPLFDSVF